MSNLLNLSTLLKLSGLGFCALTLSGCTFTKDVAQIAFDDEAERRCKSPIGGERDSIHRTANSGCINGNYVPRNLSKYEDTSKPILEKSE